MIEMPFSLIAFFVTAFGLIIGSFLNVCIYRMPRGLSVVKPRSRCPGCGSMVAAYDNIPVVSYLILGGKCRRCGIHISLFYPAVELLTGLVFLFLLYFYGVSFDFIKWVAFAALLIALTIADWQTRLLPDRLNFPGMAMGLLFSLLVPVGDGAAALLLRVIGLADPSWRVESITDALLGALAGGGLLFALGEIYFRLRHQEGMGFGDVKMMTMTGLFLGPKLVLLSIWFASVTGALIAGCFILLFRKDWRSYEIPFGTFLGASCFCMALWGNHILRWYLGYLR